MLRNLLLVVSALGLAAPVAPARSWAFDRDTLYEWDSRAGQIVHLNNTGPDTLKFDSVFAEGISPTWGMAYFLFYAIDQSGSPIELRSYAPARSLAPMRVLPGSYAVFNSLDVSFLCAIVKRAAGASTAASGDTVSARLRFKSKAAEEDTLIVAGLKDCWTGFARGPASPSPEASSTNAAPRPPLAGEPGYDALGRKPLRVPNAPLLLRLAK